MYWGESRGAESTIEQFSYKNPARDSSIPSSNSNKRQAVESICNDSHSDPSRKETGAFGTGRGPLRSGDDWASTLSEAQSKDHVQAMSGTGGLVCEDACREISDNGHSMGADVDPANMMTHVSSCLCYVSIFELHSQQFLTFPSSFWINYLNTTIYIRDVKQHFLGYLDRGEYRQRNIYLL